MFKPGQSGNPEGARVKGRRYKELFNQLADDFGGPDKLSGLQSVALAQAVRLLVKAERPRLDAEMQIKLTHCASRLLIGVCRGTMDPRKNNAPKPRVPTLEEHLAKITAERGAP